MRFENLKVHIDNLDLPAVIGYPLNSTRCGAVILHPHPLFGGNKENHVVRFLESVFLESGFITLRFDFRGAAGFREDYAGLNGALEDAKAAYDALNALAEVRNIGVAGYSFGGSIAMQLAAEKASLFLITLSASKKLVMDMGLQGLESITCPVLMMHGAIDRMVPVQDMFELAELLRRTQPSIVELKGEDHFYDSLTNPGAEIQEFLSTSVNISV